MTLRGKRKIRLQLNRRKRALAVFPPLDGEIRQTRVNY